MTYDAKKHLRKSIRLKGHDYAAPGAYFLTICAWNRQCVFGDIVSGRPQLNPVGEIVREECFEHRKSDLTLLWTHLL